MADPESTDTKTKFQKYMEDARAAEGALERAAGYAAAYLATRPRLALSIEAIQAVGLFWLGYLAGRP